MIWYDIGNIGILKPIIIPVATETNYEWNPLELISNEK